MTIAINMDQTARTAHWQTVYQQKPFEQVSWFETEPQLSRALIKAVDLQKSAAIIDVGGGDALLAEHLIDAGYTDVTVLDISQAAIDRAKQRLHDKADRISWIVADLNDFVPERTYDLWHDRAVLHFFNAVDDQAAYMRALRLAQPRHVVIGAFKVGGPTKCSGIEVKQYNEELLTDLLAPDYAPISFHDYVHLTPTGAEQLFVFGTFKRAG